MSLQDKLDAIRNDFEPKMPAEALRIMHASTDALVASGQATRALRAGDTAPMFVLSDTSGEPVALTAVLARGPAVLTFYRGVWCPYCNVELQALEAARPAIEALGASIVGISPQTGANSRRAHRENELGYPILADTGGAIAADFGLRWALQPDLRRLFEQFGVNLATFNGDDSWTLPMPARYIVREDGLIAYAEINPDYTRRPDPSELLPTLERMKAERAG